MSLLVGDVARASAVVELHLRQLMQALIDSKYAEVTAAGLAANELIETCAALTKINREITEAQRVPDSPLGVEAPLHPPESVDPWLVGTCGDADRPG